MKTITKILLTASIMALTSIQALAMPISVSQSQMITADGQSFIFEFAGLAASDGSGGQFNFFARGDYTAPNNENALVSLDFLGGSLQLGDSGVISNTIAGLSLFSNNTIAGGGGTDQILDYVFDLSGALLDSLLADANITVFVNNSTGVDNQDRTDHVVSVGFDYESGAAVAVSEPATLALLGLGAMLIGFTRRKTS